MYWNPIIIIILYYLELQSDIQHIFLLYFSYLTLLLKPETAQKIYFLYLIDRIYYFPWHKHFHFNPREAYKIFHMKYQLSLLLIELMKEFQYFIFYYYLISHINLIHTCILSHYKLQILNALLHLIKF
jgi:hypothetical protein